MKKIFLILTVMFLCGLAFSEKISLTTGKLLATSLSDYFFPVDTSVSGRQCSVTSIKKVDNDMWCISITTERNSIPITYDYYVKVGDKINLRRIDNPMKELTLNVLSVNWNEAVLEIQ